MAENIIYYALKAYVENIKLISFFSLSALVALFIPLLANTPSFNAMGGAFLRTGSIPDMNAFDIGVVIGSLLLSLYLLAFATVNINIVIKSQRTKTSIKSEVIKNITGSTLNVFMLFLLGAILLLIIQLLTFEIGAQVWLSPILSFLVWIPLFYAPAAMVIDEMRPFRAAERSFMMVFSKFHYFVLWVVLAFALLSLIDFVFLSFWPKIAPIATLVANSMVVMPFLIVLQTQMYLSKYTILD